MTDLFGMPERFDPRDHILLLEFPLAPEQAKALDNYLGAQKYLNELYMLVCGAGITMFSDAKNLSADIVRRLELLGESLEYSAARIGLDNARKALYNSLRDDPRYAGNKILARSA